MQLRIIPEDFLIIKRFLLLFIILLFVNTYSQNYKTRFYKKNFRSEYSTQKRQNLEKEKLQKQIANLFNSEYSHINEKSYLKIFKEIKLKFIRFAELENFISYVLSNQNKFSEKFIYNVIEVAYTLYPEKYTNEVKLIFDTTNSSDLFVISSKYLIKNNIKLQYLNELNTRFNQSKLLITGLKNELENLTFAGNNSPPLIDLLSYEFIKNKTIIFSFHRKNRKFPGLTIVRNPKGEFVRDSDNKIISVRQLAYSATNLPGYMRRGNTPQGIYSVQGYYITNTESIGPSPIVISRVPFEVSTSSFFHKRVAGNWDLKKYKSFLPESWREYFPITESYRAGKLGRRLIIMHGSADDLSYLKHLPYYPMTPSLGCLTTLELWDEQSGALLESDQLRLMNAFYNSGKLNGFLVVIEIDDKQKPIEIGELKNLLISAEKILKSKY